MKNFDVVFLNGEDFRKCKMFASHHAKRKGILKLCRICQSQPAKWRRIQKLCKKSMSMFWTDLTQKISKIKRPFLIFLKIRQLFLVTVFDTCNHQEVFFRTNGRMEGQTQGNRTDIEAQIVVQMHWQLCYGGSAMTAMLWQLCYSSYAF